MIRKALKQNNDVVSIIYYFNTGIQNSYLKHLKNKELFKPNLLSIYLNNLSFLKINGAGKLSHSYPL